MRKNNNKHVMNNLGGTHVSDNLGGAHVLNQDDLANQHDVVNIFFE